MQLIEEERWEIFLNDKEVLEGNKKGEHSLVGKLQANRKRNKEVLQSSLVKIWKTLKSFTIVDIRPNLFIIKFDCQYDKQRVIQG